MIILYFQSIYYNYNYDTRYVRLKVLCKGDSSQGTENKECSFSSVLTSCELSPLFLFLPSLLFPFSYFRCCGLGANFICRQIFSHHSVQVLQQDVTHPFQSQA